MQREDGMCPVKLLLLALSAMRFFVVFHMADGNSELNWLLEMLSTCRGLSVVTKDGSSGSDPLSRLKLTSRTTMLPEDMNSGGRPPEKELYERLTCSRLVRLARDGEMRPSSPLDARETLVTAPSPLQAMPSHLQQSVPLSRHDVARPPFRDSSARNRSRLRFSCSVHAVAGEAKMSSTNSATGELLNTIHKIPCLMSWVGYGLLVQTAQMKSISYPLAPTFKLQSYVYMVEEYI